MTTYFVDLDCDIHCDECQEIVHFHLEGCPVCHAKHAASDFYGDPWDCLNNHTQFKCTECDSIFEFLSLDYSKEEGEAEVKLIKAGEVDIIEEQ